MERRTDVSAIRPTAQKAANPRIPKTMDPRTTRGAPDRGRGCPTPLARRGTICREGRGRKRRRSRKTRNGVGSRRWIETDRTE